ncbi:gliding motility protein [Flavobacterium columnare]|uniref:T9SS type B sorting domain-containing protein n=1 Tax=Flavobacterium columnare TaxID=996 RepID=UPI0018966CA8|nr:T9SS type B sorting domain-containing protein [Flavobacterium columnare]MBF6654542.1 gliding motility protein [Flavobacterium columnare]
MKAKFLILFQLITFTVVAQFSKTHYLPPVSSGEIIAGEQYMYISTPSTSPVSFNITALGGNVINGTVTRNSPYIYRIGYGNNTQAHVSSSFAHTILKNKGYIIEAQDLVAVSIRIRSENSYHASSIVSKGIAALGKEFRLGAFLNDHVPTYDNSHYTFASILATENNTRIKFSNIKPNTRLINNNEGNTPSDIILNNGESFVIALKGSNSQPRNALIGALISADKPIAVNSGSFAGSNGDSQNLDMGFDQIVSAETINKIAPEVINGSTANPTEYIFIKSDGWDLAERILLIAHKDDTQIYLNGSNTADYILNSGEYVTIDGSQFSLNNNLYVKSTKNLFAYQSVGSLKEYNDNSSKDFANQEMFFVPPLSCQTPNNINNIPFIDTLGNYQFNGRITIVTKTGAILTFNINGIDYDLKNLPSKEISGPNPVNSNTNYVTYTIKNLTGNLGVFSTDELYIAAYGNNGAATFGGYYSGFTFKPEIALEKISLDADNCIPNIKLTISTASSFDTFQWYDQDGPILGANTNTYIPTKPGYYKVKASISTCGIFSPLESDNIPVSNCPDNNNGLINDNIDIDLDNDGILNCTESYGNQAINTSLNTGVIPFSSTNYITQTIIDGNKTTTPLIGNANGTIITEVQKGKQNSVTYQVQFDQPTSIELKYPNNIQVSESLNGDTEYIINSDINRTLTILNPDNQILIDTNFDGIFENGVKQFSSFEIRFRRNSTTPLQSGSGTFKIAGKNINILKIKHKNLSDLVSAKSSLNLEASCVPKDSDGDTIPDKEDIDSDNDGINDRIEAQNNTPIAISNTDTNHNGLDNAFEPGLIPVDNDKEGIPDYLDLDSDNDGILDSEEKEIDFDNDGISNYRDLDADNDLCFDVKEAGFIDANTDGILGNITPPQVDNKGKVIGFIGYTKPNTIYLQSAPISITDQPKPGKGCLLEKTKISLTSNADTFQWQISTDNGANWNNLSNTGNYSGVNTPELEIKNLSNAMTNHLFRVQLNRLGNACDSFSNNIGLIIYPLPILKSNQRLIQCTNSTNGLALFNLDKVQSLISDNYANETFSYFHTQAGATTNNVNEQIKNHETYINQTQSTEVIWARVLNSNNCFSVIPFEIYVSTAQAAFIIPEGIITACDDYVDANHDDYDGITTFDLSKNYNGIISQFNNPDIEVYFYKNENDYYQQFSNGKSLAIDKNNFTNFRNTNKGADKIWVRVENKITKACLGVPLQFELKVEAKPNIDTNISGLSNTYICTDDPDFNITLQSGLPIGSNQNDFNYEWSKDGVTIPFYTESISVNQIGTYKVKVINKTPSACFRERTINVTESNTAILNDSPIIQDLVDNSSITISVSGHGEYVFALDNINAPTQKTGYFDNLIPGVHKIYVIDLNGCKTLEVSFSILGFPAFFTPNGDGYNDYWNVIGADSIFNSDAKILIFDRFGKLLREISPSESGWDGTYLGKPLPADDYWFTTQLKDGRTSKGHFSIKR